MRKQINPTLGIKASRQNYRQSQRQTRVTQSLSEWKEAQRKKFREMAKKNPEVWNLQKVFDLRLDLQKQKT